MDQHEERLGTAKLIYREQSTALWSRLKVLQGFELLFYGDSITEQWRGTDQDG